MVKVGTVVHINKPARLSPRWWSERQQCSRCAGTGISAAVANNGEAFRCIGCLGHGYVIRWYCRHEREQSA